MASDQTARYKIYTMDGCPYCNQAKALLEYYNVQYDVVYDKAPDWDTYPGIYKINESGLELIGGFTELARYSYDNGL